MFGLQQYNCFLFSVDSTRAATVLIVYLKWAIYELQKLWNDTTRHLPFTENSRSHTDSKTRLGCYSKAIGLLNSYKLVL